jgi:hypothetical protein
MTPTLPFWLVQRQVKTEPVNEETLRLIAPNLPAYEIGIKAVDAGWSGVLYRPPGGEGERILIAESDTLAERDDAWDAAFELYRQHVIV